MSFGLHIVDFPDSLITKAYTESCELLDLWGHRGGNERALAELTGWPGVDLAETFAHHLLVARGYDEGMLDLAYASCPPDGWSMGDLFAELERTRGVDLPAEWNPGDSLPARAA